MPNVFFRRASERNSAKLGDLAKRYIFFPFCLLFFYFLVLLFFKLRTVNYIAGPGIGYRIVKNSNDPHIPAYFPTIPSAYDPEFVNPGGAYSPRPGVVPNDASDDVFKGL